MFSSYQTIKRFYSEVIKTLVSVTHSLPTMASYLSHSSIILKTSHRKPYFKPSTYQITISFLQTNSIHFIPKQYSAYKPAPHLTFHLNPCSTTTKSSSTTTITNGFLDKIEKDETLPLNEESPVKFIFWVFLWASVSVALYAFSPGDAKAQQAAVQSIKASSFGVKFANFLRGSGWPDEAVVFALATLPVIELRGAIPVGYWLQLKPLLITILSVLGLVHFPNITFIILLLILFILLIIFWVLVNAHA